jgi:cysteine desulfurase / selenocysteine lyase
MFPDALMREIKSRFHYVGHDIEGSERLFFDNAGGSFRLKSTTEAFARIDALPDCPERIHALALFLQKVQATRTDDIRTILNAVGGSVYAALTASGAMFDMVRAVTENISGTNMVTSILEHPSSFDAMSMYADRTGKELRVANSNPVTGGIDVDEIVGLVDQETCVLSVMYASNISDDKIDIETIVQRARAIKPDLYILVDAVQHAPHGLIDLQKTPGDGINIATYKFFGSRSSGLGWLSDRAAALPHHKLAGSKKDYWDRGSSAPAQFAVVTEIVIYICWIGDQFTQSSDRRALFVCGIERIERHERALLARMLNGSEGATGLRSLPGVKIFLDYEDLTKRDLILAIGFGHLGHTDAVREYERRGVIVYERVASSLYSKRMLDSFGLDGAIRISPLHCNSTSDIDRFLQITMDISEAASS